MIPAVLVALGWSTVAAGQPTPSTQPAATQPAAPAVAATVNGAPIAESQIDEVFSDIVEQQTQGRTVPPAVLDEARQRLRPQILDALIDNRLLDQKAKEMNVTVSSEDCLKAIREDLDDSLLRSGVTREEFTRQLQTLQHMTLDDFVKQRAAEPGLQQALTHAKLLEKVYPQDLVVTDAQIEARYQEELAEVFSRPEKVRASHILVAVAPSGTSEDRTAARTQIDELLVQSRAADADFAALARAHSDCSSAPQGGDLGFFPRDGAMVEPFAAAAFALNVGNISDVVETQFGYHIIKLTDRKPAETIPLDQARHAVREALKTQKLGELRQQLAGQLRARAAIVTN